MEPERRIEKLLRAFVKKRREQAGEPVDLRPTARQRLHAEISRRATEKSGGSFFATFLALFRPKLVFAVCVLALVGIGAWLLLPTLERNEPGTLSMANQHMDEFRQTAPPAAAPAPVAAAPPTTQSMAAGEDKSKAVFDARRAVNTDTSASKAAKLVVQHSVKAEATKEAAAPSVVTPPPVSTLAENSGAAPSTNPVSLAFKDQPKVVTSAAKTSAPAVDSFYRNVQTSSPPPAQLAEARASGAALAAQSSTSNRKFDLPKQAAPAAANVAAFSNFALQQNTTWPTASQAFNNRVEVPPARTRAIAGAVPPQPVLANFRVEQQGNEMRVVDADGSVYTGAVQLVEESQQRYGYGANTANTVNMPPKNTLFANQVARNVQQLQAAQNYYFHVTGTNRNLKQPVVFSGNLIPLTNSSYALQLNSGAFGGGSGGGGAAAQNQNNFQPVPTQELLSNSRISGTAVIGGQKPIEVDATPTYSPQK